MKCDAGRIVLVNRTSLDVRINDVFRKLGDVMVRALLNLKIQCRHFPLLHFSFSWQVMTIVVTVLTSSAVLLHLLALLADTMNSNVLPETNVFQRHSIVIRKLIVLIDPMNMVAVSCIRALIFRIYLDTDVHF